MNRTVIIVSAHIAWDEYRKQRNLTNKRIKSLKQIKKKIQLMILKQKVQKVISRESGNQENQLLIYPQKTIHSLKQMMKQLGNAESMNINFCEIGPKLKATVPVFENITFNEFLVPNHNGSTLCSFNEVSSEAIKYYVLSLSSNKAIADQLPLRVIKAILPMIIQSITHKVNISLSTGQFPDACKLAFVTPIFKGGDCSDPNDYRPISILPIVSKCIEHCVNEQFTDYFEINKLLTDQQFGFRKNNSTTYLTLVAWGCCRLILTRR